MFDLEEGIREWRRSMSVRLLGLAGCAVVALCWFGPVFVPSGALRDYGRGGSAISTSLAVLASLETALIGLAFVPPGRLRFRRAG